MDKIIPAEEKINKMAGLIATLPEVQALIEALEFSAAEDMWVSNGEYQERFEYKYSEWYQDRINKALKDWRKFVGSEEGE